MKRFCGRKKNKTGKGQSDICSDSIICKCGPNFDQEYGIFSRRFVVLGISSLLMDAFSTVECCCTYLVIYAVGKQALRVASVHDGKQAVCY